MKYITILGSTGSIGTQALDVVRKNPNRFGVKALTCGANIDLFKKQIEEFKPELAVVFDRDKAKKLRKEVSIDIVEGHEGIIEAACYGESDMVLNSLVGSAGILPTVKAIEAGKDIALANKETLVAAGEIVMPLLKKHNVTLKPVDSEHSAIFQCLQGYKIDDVRKMILTCSGGSFRGKTAEELESVTVKEALNHPNWSMGSKVTIDSATLLNKGLEVIEAHMIFGLDYDKIGVVVHPESIVHSLVEYKNSAMLAQLGLPDMRLPIEYALSHPDVLDNTLESLDLMSLGQLTFYKPDTTRFPCLDYAYEAGKTGGTMTCVLNAANEAAVNAFLAGKIAFMDIPRIIRKKMDAHEVRHSVGVDEILALDSRIKAEITKDVGCDC